MASVKQFSLFILLTLSSSSLHVHARESQFFNKIPSNTNTNDVYVDSKQKQQEPEPEQQPTFQPQNDDAYGLYGHETGQLPPAAEDKTTAAAAAVATNGVEFKQAQTLPKHLPKNYNPVAYVTEPEDIPDSTAFNGEQNYAVNPDNNNYYYNGRNEETESRNYYPTDVNNRYDNGNDNFYNGGSSFNSQPQGMSDTRFVENGKYFYDLNTERYNSNHPYEMFRETGQRNYYGNSEKNAGEFYGNQQQFQREENFNMP